MDASEKHIILSTSLVLLLFMAAGQTVADMKCSTCRMITESFEKGIKRTDKSNFGGGNTRWEEKSLGSWRTSETRFVDIQEKLCTGVSEEKECHTKTEKYEELLEKWWFHDFGKDTKKSLFDFLCMENVKACCENGTFGAECKPCPGGKDKPCNNHGDCDGIGTRQGTGKCLCHAEYAGEQCTECREGYYEKEKNETYLECTDCHISCKKCSAGGEENCDECRAGYLRNGTLCSDVDECAAETNPCAKNKYCSNTVGSYVCMACNAACDRCLGDGPDKCIKCRAGYEMKDGSCEDKNECEDKELCQGERQRCVNNPGSYTCACDKGFELVGTVCMPKQRKPGDKDDDDDDDDKDDDWKEGDDKDEKEKDDDYLEKEETAEDLKKEEEDIDNALKDEL